MTPKPMSIIEIAKFYTHQFKAAEALADNPDEITDFLRLVEAIRRAKDEGKRDAVGKLMNLHLMSNLARTDAMLSSLGLLKDKNEGNDDYEYTVHRI
ncbi:MAG: hypothetical protein HC875_31040 [Anaerolineales bacterium]|nr:hypothetical protein [Anaerolineales bacterium]